MPDPRTRVLLPLTKAVISPILRHVAGWAPGFGIVSTRGRRTGLVRTTPLNVFRRADTFVFALTYGAEAQWVQNAVAAGGCELVTGRRRYRLVEPELFDDPRRRLMPWFVRLVLGALGVDSFLRMRIAERLSPA